MNNDCIKNNIIMKCSASSLMGKSNTRVKLQYVMADPGKTHTQGKHISMTKLSTAERYWRNLSFLVYKGIRDMRSKKKGLTGK